MLKEYQLANWHSATFIFLVEVGSAQNNAIRLEIYGSMPISRVNNPAACHLLIYIYIYIYKLATDMLLKIRGFN
jgi:hypothetical protein